MAGCSDDVATGVGGEQLAAPGCVSPLTAEEAVELVHALVCSAVYLGLCPPSGAQRLQRALPRSSGIEPASRAPLPRKISARRISSR